MNGTQAWSAGHTAQHGASHFDRQVRDALIALDAFAAVTAVGGGLALVTGMEGDRFPDMMLEGTPFRSYLVPGSLLAGVVGGSASLAALATVRNPHAGGRASVLAGAVMMGWIAGEHRILRQQPSRGAWMEVFYFLAGLLMAGLGLKLARTAGETSQPE